MIYWWRNAALSAPLRAILLARSYPLWPHLGRSGPPDEWHLNHDKPLRHIAFDLGAGFSQVRELPVVSFLNTGLVAIGAVGDAVGGDGVEQDVV